MATNTRSKRVPKEWRKKEVNLAKLKYNRESIIGLYTISECPSIAIPDILKSSDSLTPILMPIISALPACQNSRRVLKSTKREKSVNFKIAVCLTNPDENLE